MKIQIGAGSKGLAGYVQVDPVEQPGVDVVDDGRALSSFDADAADEIYAQWFLERVARHEIAPMLKQWKRVLRPGGTVRLVTQNHAAHNQCLADGAITWEEWSYLVYAVENKKGYSVWDVHKSAWTEELISAALADNGFVEVQVSAQWGCREADGRLKCPALVASARKP